MIDQLIMGKSNNRVDQVLLDYSTAIQNVIDTHELDDLSEALIMDYITELYNKDFDLFNRDPETEVFTFYAYYDKYIKYLELNGEDSFIKLIVQLEIDKLENLENNFSSDDFLIDED